eukprot:scaffold59864_cov81-Cyclotella_meneghiniana.AAC.2
MKPLRAIPIVCIWQTTLAVAVIRKLQEECNSGSTGTQYCPQLNECIQPWAKTCPIDGLTYEGSTNLMCTEGRCSSNNKCSWTMGSATMASYYFNDLDGAFEVPEGCVLNCTGCEWAGSDNEPAILGIPNAASNSTPTGFPTSNCTGCADAHDEVGILASTSFRLLVGRSSMLGFFVVLLQNFI